MVLFKRLTAVLCTLVLCLGLCPQLAIADGTMDIPETAPLFTTYKEMSGVALDSRVANKAHGSNYIGYWGDTAYTFRVGVDIFADFESACAAIEGEEKNIFVLTGHHGDLTINQPANLYGYYYDVNPNQPHGEALGCPTLNQVRQEDRESCFDNITVAEGVTGDINLKGVVLRGGFYDINRAISADATNILLENIIVRQEEGIPGGGTQVFRFDNPNSKNSGKSAADNKDTAKVLNCRVEKLSVIRLFGNHIPPVFTVDGLVTVSGCTPFFGFPQWRRYMENAVFTLQNCHFENFVSPEGKKYFMVMEGLNKFNGDCTVNIKNNVFTGDATSGMVRVYTKVGYDINITGNSFLAKTKTGLEPFYWNTTYDTTLYDDYATNADVSNTDLSAIIEISKNRFIGYTKFSNTVNSITAFNIADNFFTNDLKAFKTVLGGFPTKSTGWNATSYWVDFDFTTYGTTIPKLIFTSDEVIDGSAAKLLYTSASTVNLYDYGMTLPKGVKFSLSGSLDATAIPVTEGVRTVQIKVYSYDGTRSATTSLMIYGRLNYADAVAALHEANVRINSGCYTTTSLSDYETAANLLQNALTAGSDPAEYLTSLTDAKAKLAFKSGAEAELKYFDYFPALRKFKIVDVNDWKKFSATIVDTVSLSGYTIRLANDIDFGGATIKPIGGCYATSGDSGNYSFNGTFDGGGYELSNFVIKQEAYGVGLFGKLYRATVKNLCVGSGSITGIDKVGGIAGYADSSSTIRNCTNKASVIATDGTNGIGGIVSQARGGTKVIGCINYGSVTATNGRSCGIAAWCQSAAVLNYCINYGALSAPVTYPLGVYTAGFDASDLVVGCYFASGISTCGGELVENLTNINELAWLGGYKTFNGELTNAHYGCQIYRAALNCTTNNKTYYYYGAANSQIGFEIPGYVVDTVNYGGADRPLKGLLITKDCTMTAEAIRVTYDIIYNTDGGTLPTDAQKTYVSDKEAVLPDIGSVKKSGYVFYGWYNSADFSGDPIHCIPAESKGDRTFYAKYLPIDRTITTAAQLVSFANAVNGGTNFAGKAVVLGANINLSGTTYSVIGSALGTPFKGVLYGAGYQIKNLSVSGKPLAGLVGVLGAGGAVANLQVQGTVSGNVAGGIVANNIGGRVVACSFDGKVTSTATELRIISQNLRVNSADDPYLVSERHTAMKNILLTQNPDIIGFQEAE
ncbi:MAG: InlB B-repeat-containing protein, partial [Clostridia bacterium]|nr:InlB B-repeat-containing protein [Clostridia bacterium]